MSSLMTFFYAVDRLEDLVSTAMATTDFFMFSSSPQCIDIRNDFSGS